VDEEIDDDQELPIAGGVRVLHTPGHTAGHVSLWVPSKRLLFAGDAASNLFGRIRPPFGMFTEDMVRAKESMRRLAELDFETACFGHGGVLRGRDTLRFHRFVERLGR
jgi:glyoxylase-like metal-dependent hydrolase (beta-lactamase superfamily II)